MSKNNIIKAIAAAVILLIAFCIYKSMNPKHYSVIELSTGEVYIGKLSTFPRLTLKDSYILQVTKDATDSTKNTFSLQPTKETVWAPKKLFLVKENVIFYGPLNTNSKIAQTLSAQSE